MMKTETDKAIEYLKEGIKDGESLRELKSLDEREKNELTKSINKINMVITLLQQGEKYKKMWNEIEARFNTLHTDYETGEQYYSGGINASDIKDIKQKYFPKEAKDNETKNSWKRYTTNYKGLLTSSRKSRQADVY